MKNVVAATNLFSVHNFSVDGGPAAAEPPARIRPRSRVRLAAGSFVAVLAALVWSAVMTANPAGAQVDEQLIEIENGEFLSCGIVGQQSDNEVRCWGARPGSTPTSVPEAVAGLTDVRSVAVGANHACAVLADRTAVCWGDNSRGQLGDGTLTSRADPAPVLTLSSVTQLSAGYSHTCALTGGGDVWCWGDNFKGQLGDGTNTTRLSPVPVVGANGMRTIGLGWEHTCAVSTSGGVACWGDNGEGQLGDGTTDNRNSPTPVAGIADAMSITGGKLHTCGLRATGSISCWGDNDSGKLGDGTFEPRTTIVDVVGINDAVDVAAGTTHSCAVLAAGGARCWGENRLSLLGDDTRQDRATPVDVLNLTGATAIDVGFKHTCVIAETPSGAACWGANHSGELGTGDEIDRSLPEAVVLTDNSTAIVGSVTSSFGAPIEGLTLDLFTEGRASYLRSTRTAANGTYRLDLDPGCFAMTFIALPDTTFSDGQSFQNVDFCVDTGQVITADTTLIDSRDTSVSLEGSVGFVGGPDVDGVAVDLFTSDANGNRIEFLRSTVTGPDDGGSGEYLFEGLDPGCYSLTFIAPAGTMLRNPDNFQGQQWLNVLRCLEPGSVARSTPSCSARFRAVQSKFRSKTGLAARLPG